MCRALAATPYNDSVDGTCAISCKPCGSDGGVVHSLPRVNIKVQSVSADLGAYDLVECDPSEGTCKLTSLSFSQFKPSYTTLPKRDVVNYVQVTTATRHLGALRCLWRALAPLCTHLRNCDWVPPPMRPSPVALHMTGFHRIPRFPDLPVAQGCTGACPFPP